MFAASGTANADNVNPYPALPMQNLASGLCIDSNWAYGQPGTTPAYVTECNSNHLNQGWFSTPYGSRPGEVQIYDEWAGCLQAVPATQSVVVAPCTGNNPDQGWAVYPQGGPNTYSGIWSYDFAACGYNCYLADDNGLALGANNGSHPPAYETWTAPQSG